MNAELRRFFLDVCGAWCGLLGLPSRPTWIGFDCFPRHFPVSFLVGTFLKELILQRGDHALVTPPDVLGDADGGSCDMTAA